MHFSTLFFDLDDTLYPSSNGLWEAIRRRMGQYMAERLGLPEQEIPALRRHYYMTYGTTLRGLQKHHQVDADDYLAYVHDLPLEHFLQPAPQLRSMLLSLPQQRWIFTNADADHANRVLEFLGLAGCFCGIIDVRAIGFACKPEDESYQRALALAGSPLPAQCVLMDDSLTNLGPAHRMGFTTVLVSQDGLENPAADFSIPDICRLPEVMPDLWDNKKP